MRLTEQFFTELAASLQSARTTHGDDPAAVFRAVLPFCRDENEQCVCASVIEFKIGPIGTAGPV